MQWQLYGWTLIALPVLQIALSHSDHHERTPQERIAFGIANFCIFLPLAGHLIGWW